MDKNKWGQFCQFLRIKKHGLLNEKKRHSKYLVIGPGERSTFGYRVAHHGYVFMYSTIKYQFCLNKNWKCFFINKQNDLLTRVFILNI